VTRKGAPSWLPKIAPGSVRDDVARARRHLEKAASEDCDQADFAREELALLQSR